MLETNISAYEENKNCESAGIIHDQNCVFKNPGSEQTTEAQNRPFNKYICKQ